MPGSDVREALKEFGAPNHHLFSDPSIFQSVGRTPWAYCLPTSYLGRYFDKRLALSFIEIPFAVWCLGHYVSQLHGLGIAGAGQKWRMCNLIKDMESSKDGASFSSQRAGLFYLYRSFEHEQFPTPL